MAAGGTASPPPEAMRRGVSRGVFVATVVIVAIIALAGGMYVGKTVLGSSSSSSSSPYLVVGTNVPFPPFESYNNTTGAYVGFDMNFSQMVANALHRTLVIDNYADFGILLSDVGAGVIDMAASSITESGAVGAQRNSTMSFSIPYYDANQAILVKAGSSFTCPSVSAGGCGVAQLADLTIGVQSGTSSLFWCQSYLIPNETKHGSVEQFTTVDTEINLLITGSLNAVMIDLGPATAIAASNPGSIVLAGEVLTNELYGFAVAHGDPEHILPTINSVITQSEQNGTYDKLIHEWFG
jgi:polar amino acid transport system substrate-binding protein